MLLFRILLLIYLYTNTEMYFEIIVLEFNFPKYKVILHIMRFFSVVSSKHIQFLPSSTMDSIYLNFTCWIAQREKSHFIIGAMTVFNPKYVIYFWDLCNGCLHYWYLLVSGTVRWLMTNIILFFRLVSPFLIFTIYIFSTILTVASAYHRLGIR